MLTITIIIIRRRELTSERTRVIGVLTGSSAQAMNQKKALRTRQSGSLLIMIENKKFHSKERGHGVTI